MIVDMHSHVLANVDDGSSSLAESVAMLRLEAQQGISRVVATPHFYAREDTPERFLDRRQEAVEADVKEIKSDVKFLSGKSGRRWDEAVDRVCWAVLAALTAFLLAKLGI